VHSYATPRLRPLVAACWVAAWLTTQGCARRDGSSPSNVKAAPKASESSSSATVKVQQPKRLPSVSVSGDGLVSLVGKGERAVHNHPGPPAHIGSAEFEVRNGRARPVVLSVKSIDWLVGRACAAPSVEGHPAFAEIRRKGSVNAQGAVKTWTVPANTTVELEVGYALQEAYMNFCDVFVTRVHFDIDGEELSAAAEHEVVRRTPRRR